MKVNRSQSAFRRACPEFIEGLHVTRWDDIRELILKITDKKPETPNKKLKTPNLTPQKDSGDRQKVRFDGRIQTGILLLLHK